MIGTKILEERKSKYNGIVRVSKTIGMGTYIQVGNLTQSGGIVKTIWRQTLKHIHPSHVRNVLILGLGGGTVANLISKKYPKAKITGVEIDPVMIDLGKKYLKLDDIKADIKITDALKFLKSKSLCHYDLIVVDLYNGDRFPKEFETEKYIKIIKTILTKDGLAIFNRLYYGDKRSGSIKFGKMLEGLFEDVKWYYPEANLMFIVSKNP